jgi:hypothetical protein
MSPAEPEDVVEAPATGDADAHDDAIRAVVARLARPHASGGMVVERAALLAEGADFAAVMAWITAHGGEPEAMAPAAPSAGLHAARTSASAAPGADRARRFLFPPGALAESR